MYLCWCTPGACSHLHSLNIPQELLPARQESRWKRAPGIDADAPCVSTVGVYSLKCVHTVYSFKAISTALAKPEKTRMQKS